jgi:F-type H+-transporting ATPase subunit alpha
MVATLNQPQYQPWPLEEQVVAIFSGIHSYLDDIPPSQVPRFQDELREYLRTEGGVYDELRDKKDISDELEERIHAAIKKFKESFAVLEDTGLVGAAAG